MQDGWTTAGLLEEMRARGDAPAMVAVTADGTDTLGNQALADQALRLATGLIDAGLRPGDAVALWGPNSFHWVIAAFAVTVAGGIVVAVDDHATDEDAAAIIAGSGSRRVFASAEHAPAVLSMSDAGTRSLALIGDAGAEDGEQPSWRSLCAAEPGPLPTLTGDMPALLVFTSGTTGQPKSFHLTHANIAANVDGVISARIVAPGDRALLPLPFHHAYPWVVGVLTAMTAGVTVVLPEAVTGPHLVHALKAGRVTVMMGVPRLYEAVMTGLDAKLAAKGALVGRLFSALRRGCSWSRERLGVNAGRVLFAPIRKQMGPDLRLMVSGGARLDPAVIRNIKGLGWEILTGYGLAETASIFTFNTPQAQRVGSEGRPAARNSEIRIANPDETGAGEVQLRGPSVFSGYLNNPEANAAAFTEDGWFRTGDLGRLEDGYVIVLGRLKELIVLSGGKNIDPEAVETIYAEHPHIAEIGVTEKSGALVAVVRPDLAAMRADNLTRVDDAIRVALAEIGRHRPDYERLTGFAITRETLPRTRLMKLRRFLLPEIYDRALAGGERQPAAVMSEEDRALIADSPARDAWALLQEKFPHMTLGMETSPQLDLGMDSFAWMTFLAELEQRAGVRMDEDAVGRIETLRDLVLEVKAAATAPVRVPGAEVDAMLRPPGLVLRSVGFVVFGFLKVIMRSVFRLRVEGLENLPAQGPLVLTPNHVSDLDPVAVAASLPFGRLRRTWWGADVVRLQATLVGRRLCRAVRVYSVSERSPAVALTAAGRVLQREGTQVWFPESWRSPDGNLQRFLPGIGKLLSETKATAVPVLIEGTFEAMPRDRSWPRAHRVRVTFGRPVPYDLLREAALSDDDFDGIAMALRDQFAQMAAGHRSSTPTSNE